MAQRNTKGLRIWVRLKPPVTFGPQTVGRHSGRHGDVIPDNWPKRNGTRVIRFYISQRRHAGIELKERPGEPWYVFDTMTNGIARGTKEEGYIDKEEALQVARKYRDTYGAYCRVPF